MGIASRAGTPRSRESRPCVALVEGTTWPLASSPDEARPVWQRRLRLGTRTPIELLLPGQGEPGPGCGMTVVLGCSANPVAHPRTVRVHRCMARVCPDCGPTRWAWREAVHAHARVVEWCARVYRHFLPSRLAEWPTGRLLRHVVLSEDSQTQPETKEELDALYGVAYRRVLAPMGFVGGAIVFHPFRHDGQCTWFDGPHFHAIGFGRVDENLRPAGWVVKDVTHVRDRGEGKPRSWPATLKYVLDHSLVPRAADHRYHSIRWFGALSYTKFSSRDGRDTTSVRTDFCTVCGAEMRPLDQLLPPDTLDALELARFQLQHRRDKREI